MAGRFENKVALVIGGGRGMGRTIAERFVAEGATVVITARAIKYGEQTVADIKAKGGKAFLVPCEINNRASMKNMVEEAARLAGKLDIVVLSAAANTGGLIENMSDEAIDELIHSNIHSLFWLAKDVVPHLSKAKDKGRLILISSSSANRVFMPGLLGYVSSKAFMNCFGRGLAPEFGPHNILVNIVESGMVASDRFKTELSDEAAAAITRSFPVPRVGTPDDIADSVLFLSSNEASYISGATLIVDGGATTAVIDMSARKVH